MNETYLRISSHKAYNSIVYYRLDRLQHTVCIRFCSEFIDATLSINKHVCITFVYLYTRIYYLLLFSIFLHGIGLYTYNFPQQ